MGKELPKSICAFGAAYMLKQVLNLDCDIADALTSKDTEAIHRMRVSSRRLRNGIGLFKDCFPRKKGKAWDDEIRKVTRSLGNARDLDIQIGFINQGYEESLAATYRPGYRRLLLRLKQQRVKAQEKVKKTLKKLQEREVLGQMRSFFEARIAGNGDVTHVNPLLFDYASQAINHTLEDFLNYQPYVAAPENTDKLHAMRIAGKHLRYTLETFAPIYGCALNPYINLMKEIQDHLGAFHDTDVWVKWLPKFIKKEQTRIEDYFGNTGPLERLLPGLQHLLEDREEARGRDYQTFLEIWEILEGENTWNTLKGIITESIHDEPQGEENVIIKELGLDDEEIDESQDQVEFEVEIFPESWDDPETTSETNISPEDKTQDV